jgi:hypothetical protein
MMLFHDAPYGLLGIHILGTPDDDDLEYNTYTDEAGNNLEEDMRELHEDNHIYIMVSSNRLLNNENEDNFIVHYITEDSFRPLFTTGGDADAQVVNQHRVRTVKKMTIYLIHHISEGLRNARRYLIQQGRADELPNTDPVLYEFFGPSLDTLATL